MSYSVCDNRAKWDRKYNNLNSRIKKAFAEAQASYVVTYINA